MLGVLHPGTGGRPLPVQASRSHRMFRKACACICGLQLDGRAPISVLWEAASAAGPGSARFSCKRPDGAPSPGSLCRSWGIAPLREGSGRERVRLTLHVSQKPSRAPGWEAVLQDSPWAPPTPDPELEMQEAGALLVPPAPPPAPPQQAWPRGSRPRGTVARMPLDSERCPFFTADQRRVPPHSCCCNWVPLGSVRSRLVALCLPRPHARGSRVSPAAVTKHPGTRGSAARPPPHRSGTFFVGDKVRLLCVTPPPCPQPPTGSPNGARLEAV